MASLPARPPDLVGGAHGTQGVILVDGRDPEDRHHRVADELLDRATVAFHDSPDGREIATHQGSQRFGVELLSERGAAGDVGKQDGHRPSDVLDYGAHAAQLLTALGAELGPVRV